jgi:argininosuccinate lyase
MASKPITPLLAMDAVRQQVLFMPQMQIHLAHCLMLEEQQIISKEVAQRLLAELITLLDTHSEIVTTNYMHLEQHLVSVLGPDVAGRLQTARSRNDLGVTAWRMVLRELLLNVRESLLTLRDTLLTKADAYAEIVMPGYSHSQHAQPITLGYYLAAFADALARDTRRLESAYATNNCSPLGAAALTTTGFPIDRQATAKRLGFDGLVENGLDAVASRDDAEEASCALAVLGVHLARIAEDLFIWHTFEFGFIEFGEENLGGSSIMPQKKNPGLLEFIKRHSGYLIGTSTQVLAATRGAWFTDAGDGKEAGNDPLLSATDSAIACLETLSSALQTMEIKPERMLKLAQSGFGTMTEVADTIVRETGHSFRIAHNIVSQTVAAAIESGKLADEITPEMIDETSQKVLNQPLGISRDAIIQALDPAENIRRRTVTGGPAPSELRRMISQRQAQLTEERNRLANERKRLAECRQRLINEAKAFVEKVEAPTS